MTSRSASLDLSHPAGRIALAGSVADDLESIFRNLPARSAKARGLAHLAARFGFRFSGGRRRTHGR